MRTDIAGRLPTFLPELRAQVNAAWKGIIDDCLNETQRSINVGSNLRRKAILAINEELQTQKEIADQWEKNYRRLKVKKFMSKPIE